MFLKISDMQMGKVRFSETFAPGAIELFEPQLRQVEPLVAAGEAELLEATFEIRVTGHLKTRIEIPCDCCLELVEFPIESAFSLLYRPAALSPERDEVAIAGSEAEIDFYEGEGLELSDVLREQVLLLIPMHRVCREGCKGICPVCGTNRNQADCNCQQVVTDDRWAGLRNL